MKKLMSLILAVLMMSAMMIPSFAAVITPGESISPNWNYMSTVTVEVSFLGTAGCATVDVSRIFGVTTSLEGVLTVYEDVDGEWVYVDSVSGSSTRSLGLELYFTATSGTTYMAVADITAYSSTGSESDSLTDTETCP